ncbi:MAG TPA: CcmD family protein [Rhodothermales bacterium]|nr:CcmD family protein [Rhodothermales bacterium]
MNSHVKEIAWTGSEFVLPLQSQGDSSQTTGVETAYDSIWAAEVPVADPSPLERIMLAEDKLYVVLAVVLVIWFGIVAMLVRTDRKIKDLERRLSDEGLEGQSKTR